MRLNWLGFTATSQKLHTICPFQFEKRCGAAEGDKPEGTDTLAQGDIEVSLAVDLANPRLGFDRICKCQETAVSRIKVGPITLYLSLGERVNAVVARRRVGITRAHLASHPVYCALTLLTRVVRR